MLYINLKSQSGYTLYLIVVVLLITGILFSVSIRTSGAAHILAVRHLQSTQAKLLAHSGLARAEYFLNGGDGHDLNWETDKYEEQIDTYGKIELSCQKYGFFSRVQSRGIRLIKEYALDGLVSRDVPTNIAPAITLSGHVGGMVLDRNTTLKGNVVIHHGEVVRGKRRDRIPGSDRWTTISESPPLPFDRKVLEDTFNRLSNQLMSSLSDPKAIKGNYILNSNNDSLLQLDKLVILGDCSIQGVHLDQKTIITAGELSIEKGCIGENTIIMGETVNVIGGDTRECLIFSQTKMNIKGGNHKSQFIALDSIVVENEAQFNEANLWACYRRLVNDSTVTGGVYFPERSDIVGHVICFSDTTEKGSIPYAGPSISLGARSSFTGTLITDGDINIKDVTFEGHIWARSLATKHEDVLYKNWLIQCKLSSLKESMSFPLLGELPAKVSLMQ